jgi:hypothetical protein
MVVVSRLRVKERYSLVTNLHIREKDQQDALLSH